MGKVGITRWSAAISCCCCSFLYLPIVVMMVMAFNRSPLYELPFVFDLIGSRRCPTIEQLLDAGLNSVIIALVNTVIATTLGTMAALAFARYSFRGKTLLQMLLFPPITIPWLIIGNSMLVLFYLDRHQPRPASPCCWVTSRCRCPT